MSKRLSNATVADIKHALKRTPLLEGALALIAELEERRAADLSDEDRTALRLLLGASDVKLNQYERALLERITSGGVKNQRSADLTPLQIEALEFAVCAIDFYGSSRGRLSSTKEIQTMRDAVTSIIRAHGATP